MRRLRLEAPRDFLLNLLHQVIAMKRHFIQLLIIGVFVCGHSFAQGPGKTSGEQKSVTSDTVLKMKQRFLLYLPPSYDEIEEHPLLLFLHGAGERSDDNLDLVKVHGPPKLIEMGKAFPFIVVSPQCNENEWWDAAQLSALLDHVEENYKVDRKRIYVTGLSMGGYGTWALAFREADRIAAIAPICGGGNAIALRYAKQLTAPCWAFHGAKDGVVPLSKSEEMVEGLQRNGVEAKLTVYPDAGHDSWTETYNNSALYEWLLEHKRPD